MSRDLIIGLHESSEESEERFEGYARDQRRMRDGVDVVQKVVFDFGECDGWRKLQEECQCSECLGKQGNIRRRDIGLDLRNEV